MISDAHLRRLIRSEMAVALFGDLLRVAVVIVIAIACLAALVFQWILWHEAVAQLHFNDFGRFYYSARLFLEHGDMYGATPATAVHVADDRVEQLLNVNPPFFAVVILPFAQLSPFRAFVAWTVCGLLSLAVGLALVVRELRLRVTASGALWSLAGLLLFAGTSAQIVTGQVAWLFVAPITVGWIAVRRQRWTAAAIIWGICISLKPFLGVFLLYLVVRRDWSTVFRTVATVVCCYIVSLSIFGVQLHIEWLSAMSMSSRWAWLPMNGSVYSLFSRAFSETPAFAAIIDVPAAILPLWLLASIALGIRAVTVWRQNVDVDRDVMIVLLLSSLVSPLGWIYYLWWLLGPAFATYRRGLVPWTGTLGLAGLLWPLYGYGIGQPHKIATLVVGSLYVWSQLLIYCAVAMGPMSDL